MAGAAMLSVCHSVFVELFQCTTGSPGWTDYGHSISSAERGDGLWHEGVFHQQMTVARLSGHDHGGHERQTRHNKKSRMNLHGAVPHFGGYMTLIPSASCVVKVLFDEFWMGILAYMVSADAPEWLSDTQCPNS